MQPLSVRFAPNSNGSTGGGTRLIRKGTPGQLTDPLPLIKIESPHLDEGELGYSEKRLKGAV